MKDLSFTQKIRKKEQIKSKQNKRKETTNLWVKINRVENQNQ